MQQASPSLQLWGLDLQKLLHYAAISGHLTSASLLSLVLQLSLPLWSFLGAFQEIPNVLIITGVSSRNLLARNSDGYRWA